MIAYTSAGSSEDLLGILNLQKANLPETLSRDQIESQGFVTVTHSYEQLKRLNDIEKHTIAKDEQKVVAYLLAMTEQSKHDIPILIPMFEMFNSILYANKLISAYKYMVVGQVCIDKDYRGQGILENCYDSYRKQFMDRYDFAITEIASTNLRSLRAHNRIGFEEISRYTADNIEWCIVLWNWNSGS
jgi:predicted GNAT superfamily acetyltransferase